MGRLIATPAAVLLWGLFILGGCAAPTRTGNTAASTVAPDQPTPVSMPAITYIVPTNAAYVSQNGVVNDLNFATYDNGPRVDHQMLSLKRDGATLVVELKRANSSNIGSAIVYRVGVATEKLENGYKVELKPLSYTTYKQGLISFGLPSFTESDLAAFLLTPVLHYRIEIDSEFNSESTFANFKRLLQSRPFAKGERDPVTGKIFTQQFILPYRGKSVLFVAETFPYRNGSKVVMNLRMPSVFTSPNTVDYAVILDDVTKELRRIITS